MKKIFTGFIFILLISSCTKDIIIKQLPYESQLSIECILYPNNIPKLFLSKSVASFSSNVIPQQLFARGATVTIKGGSGTDNLLPDSTFDNFRCRWVPFYKGSIPAQIGGTYNLSVTYNGKIYTASTTINQPKPVIQSISYVKDFHDVYGGHEGVVVNFTDVPGSENYYRFQMNRWIDNGVYGTSNLSTVHSTCTNGDPFYITETGRTIFNDKNIDGQPITMTIEPAFDHQQDDSTYVFVQSLDKNSAEFYDNIDKQKLSQVNPFVEPVFLKTKIEGCIGIFGSAIPSDSILFIFPE
jgi:hypothetical protein